jgi:hypothetical protein
MADLYGAIKDSAVNRLIRAVMAFRPDLFNYAAPSWKFAGPAKLLATEVFVSCYQVGLARAADPAKSPRFTRIPYLPAPGLGSSLGDFQLPWCFQISDARIDFQPTDQITTMPPELTPPLAAQRFGLEIDATFGIACPPPEVVQSMLNPNRLFRRATTVIPVEKLRCFQLQLYLVAHLEKTQTGTPPVDTVGMQVDGLEIVDLSPPGLETAVECYLNTVIQVVVLPQLKLALEPIVVKALGLSLTITPTLATDVPTNPSIEQDELRVWVNVKIS